MTIILKMPIWEARVPYPNIQVNFKMKNNDEK